MNDDTALVAENGILLVDKPAGMSSFGVVARVRRQLSERAGTVMIKGKDGVLREKRRKVKVGHTGTLDPFATGLLIILTGKETKHASDFLKLDKEYIATIRLGEISTTGDPEGEITPYAESLAGGLAEKADEGLAENLSEKKVGKADGDLAEKAAGKLEIPILEDVEHVVYSFVGEIEQRVPNFSAVKINGQRAYKLARAGKAVEMPVRKIKIYEIEILSYEWPELVIRCKVSSGTYIRTLGEDIGKALNVGGYLTALRRTQVGNYRIEDAVELPRDMKTRETA